ncbi:MAG: hypothetical protein OER86_10415, partial [Phycisphaerae bacterium]|nr:hypothetical protein [Phycisphaerae bacterium]
MSYAIIQTDEQRPTREQLTAAFESVDFLTTLDAPTIARDSYGIVVENLSRSEALKLGRALGRAGVGVEVVAQSRLA